MPPARCRQRQDQAARNRGSVLIVTLVFAAGVALSLGSFLAICVNAAKLSQQSFHGNSALNLAEAGLEEGLNAANNGSYTAWSPHAIGANSRSRTIDDLKLGQGATGQIKILIYDITTATRKIVAEGIVRPASGPPVRKQVEISATRRSLFASGFVAKDTMTFSGNGVTVDSWNLDPDNDAATAPIPYSDAVKRDHGSVGSTAVSITLGNADVWGFVGTGGNQPGVGPNGTIAGFGNPEGTKDPSRISTSFKHNFEPITKPTDVTLNVISSTIGQSGQPLPMTLPQPGDVATFDPVEQVDKYYYQLPGIDASGNASKILTIAANVVLLPTAGSGGTAIGVGGNASIQIAADAMLEIFTAGDIAIAGNGIVNSAPTASTIASKLSTTNQPKTLRIWGTNTSAMGQDISISGNGVLSAITYAPNADLSINGGGSTGQVLGSFVARTIKLTGNNSFHYDESLKNFGGANAFELESWRELFGSERISF